MKVIQPGFFPELAKIDALHEELSSRGHQVLVFSQQFFCFR